MPKVIPYNGTKEVETKPSRVFSVWLVTPLHPFGWMFRLNFSSIEVPSQGKKCPWEASKAYSLQNKEGFYYATLKSTLWVQANMRRQKVVKTTLFSWESIHQLLPINQKCPFLRRLKEVWNYCYHYSYSSFPYKKIRLIFRGAEINLHKLASLHSQDHLEAKNYLCLVGVLVMIPLFSIHSPTT